MAYVRGGLDRILIKYPDLDLARVRLVGWGAGQAFRDYFPHTGLNLEYTICPRPENQGKTLHGVPVRSPEILQQEDCGDVLVVIFSAYAPEIMNQIRNQFGPFPTVQAVELSENTGYITELQAFQKAMRHGLKFERQLPNQDAELGLFMQGPLTESTPFALAYHRLKYPGAYFALVTWNTESQELVDACRPWVDRLEQIEPPLPTGYDARNYITRSCKAASDLMEEAGVRYVVRIRSDAIVVGSIYRTLERLYGDGSKNIGKIGMLLQASWAYIPFHFSDKLIICRTEDMIQLWSLPEDERGPETFPPPFTHPDFLSMNFLDFRHYSWEARLWGSYAKKLEYATDTLEDAYRFARERLLEIDSDTHMVSIKHIPLFNMKLLSMLEPSPEWWKEMHQDFEGALRQVRSVSASGMTMADFFSRRIG